MSLKLNAAKLLVFVTYMVALANAAATQTEQASKPAGDSTLKATSTGKKSILNGPFAPSQTYASPGQLTAWHARLWFLIGFFIALVWVLKAMMTIDDVKNRDTILFAKFLTNVKDK